MADRHAQQRIALQELLLVSLGAVPGALLRWQLTPRLDDHNLLVNIAGAALLGLLSGLPAAPKRQLLVGIGFCGSLTTFSSWMLAVVKQLAEGRWGEAIGLIGLTFGVGLGAAALGFVAGRRIRPPGPPQLPS